MSDQKTINRMALYLQDSHDLRDGLDYVRYAEKRGFEAVWQAESRLAERTTWSSGPGITFPWVKRDSQRSHGSRTAVLIWPGGLPSVRAASPRFFFSALRAVAGFAEERPAAEKPVRH